MKTFVDYDQESVGRMAVLCFHDLLHVWRGDSDCRRRTFACPPRYWLQDPGQSGRSEWWIWLSRGQLMGNTTVSEVIRSCIVLSHQRCTIVKTENEDCDVV